MKKNCAVCKIIFKTSKSYQICCGVSCGRLFTKKVLNGDYGTFELFSVKCNKCSKDLEVKEYSLLHPYNPYYFCGRSCANRHIHTQKSKDNISNGVKKYYEKTYGIDYSNKIKIEKTYNIKQKNNPIKIKKIKVNKLLEFYKDCISCNIEINSHKKYCDECRGMSQWIVKFFPRLNINNSNRKEAFTECINILSNNYFNEKMSLPEIRDKYNLNLNSLRIFFKKANIELRNVTDGIASSVRKNGSKVFPFKSTFHISHTGQTFHTRSSWELRVAKALDEIKEPYEFELLTIPFIDHMNKDRLYLPDFYLSNRNLILEPKSPHIYLKHKNKIDKQIEFSKKLGYFHILMFEKDIKNFEKDPYLILNLYKSNFLTSTSSQSTIRT